MGTKELGVYVVIVRNRERAKELEATFRNIRAQVYQKPREERTKPRRRTSRPTANTYEEKCRMYEGEELFKSFNAPDIVYYFRDVAAKAGEKYVISSMQKDAACIKRLMKDYSNLIICLMIEFLFNSGQTYIKYPSPGVLASGWCNRIHRDALDWSEGRFDPSAIIEPKKSKRSLREWEGSAEEQVQIGEW